MFAQLESWVHRLRQRMSRSEWAIRHLGLSPSEGTAEEPGLLLLQIDGFSRAQLERALASGRMPFLQRLLRRDGYRAHTFYPGLPSTTPAVQAELYYGLHSAVPAFSFYQRSKRQMGMMYYPEWAKTFESVYQEKAEGLLKGGSSWSNIYTGGAAPDESHFCAASIGFGDMWKTGKIRNIFLFILFQFPASLRIARLLFVEFFAAIWDVIDGVRHGERLGLEVGMAISRIFIGTGLRELLTIGGKVDVTRGLPIVHINFLSYDEHSHRRGPGSRFAHWSLREIDRSIKELFRAAHRSRRRDYSVWIFSDHGQEKTRSFALEIEGGVEKVIRDCLEISQKEDSAWKARSQRRPIPNWFSQSYRAQKKRRRSEEANTLTSAEKTSFSVAAAGPVGHIYFANPLDYAQRLALARRLVMAGKIPGVLLFEGQAKRLWVHAGGETQIPDQLPEFLPYPRALSEELSKDLLTLCANEDAGDLILLGWSPGTSPWTFAPERGAHAGLGPEETRGFVLMPAHTPLPPGTNDFIRPSALRSAALYHLGRTSFAPSEPKKKVAQFRLMTYNTHSCVGNDGRISPRRIARVLAAESPDIIALQELDLGRRRSRTEDQAALIAKQLGFHYVFCPTVTHDGEHYGHALLSRWPITIGKRAFLPSDKQSWWKEPRAALWARVQVGSQKVNVITTHLGLGPRERKLQVEALLGPEWIGAIPDDEAVMICGDLNLTPRSLPYRQLAKRLFDVQRFRQNHRPLSTFTSIRPFTRLDHVFVSSQLQTQQVDVPRNHLTRVASDHLPLVVELRLQPAVVETPMHSLV